MVDSPLLPDGQEDVTRTLLLPLGVLIVSFGIFQFGFHVVQPRITSISIVRQQWQPNGSLLHSLEIWGHLLDISGQRSDTLLKLMTTLRVSILRESQ